MWRRLRAIELALRFHMNPQRRLSTLVAILSVALFVLCSGPLDWSRQARAATLPQTDAVTASASTTGHAHSELSVTDCGDQLAVVAAPTATLQGKQALHTPGFSPASIPYVRVPDSLARLTSTLPPAHFSLIEQSVQIQI